MSLVNLFVNKFKGSNINRYTADGSAVYIPMDCILNEQLDVPAEITEHPVESGAPATDHIILKPKTLTIEGIISATPIDLSSALQGAVTAVGGALTGAALKTIGGSSAGKFGTVSGSVVGGLFGKSVAGLLGVKTNENRLADAVTELIAARDSKAPVVMQTGLRTYPGEQGVEMYVKNVTIKRDQSTGDAIRVTVVFQEIIRVTSQLAVLSYPKKSSGAKKKNAGRKEASVLEAAKNKSISASLYDSVTGFFTGGVTKGAVTK